MYYSHQIFLQWFWGFLTSQYSKRGHKFNQIIYQFKVKSYLIFKGRVVVHFGLNIFYPSHDIIKDQAEKKAVFIPLHFVCDY